MSDVLHLNKLRAGAVAWNAWRRENPGIVPDLNGLEVSASELQFGSVQGGPADFSRAELNHAVLVHATLIDANLAGASLVDADLSDSRLNNADLRGADLRSAKFAGADLTGARLDGAFVCGADLHLARGLTQHQIDRALGNQNTALPPELEMPGTWLSKDGTGNRKAGKRNPAQDPDALANAYAVLGVKPTASVQQIRVAWLRLVKELHPDIGFDDPSASEQLKAINRAYQNLKSIEHREMMLRAERNAAAARATFVVFLLLPVAAALAIGAWTYGVEAPVRESVAAIQELVSPGDPAVEVGSSQVSDAVSKPTIVAEGQLEGLPARAAEVAALPDQAAEDDAAWTRAAAEATSASLHSYLGRYPQGRHAQKAMDDLTHLAGVEVALATDYRSQDAAAVQQAVPMLRRYLVEYPMGQLADEARGKLAQLEAGGRPEDVAWSEQKAGKVASAEDLVAHRGEVVETKDHRVAALAETSATQPDDTQTSLRAYLDSRSNGRRADVEKARVAELETVLESRPVAVADIKTAKPVLRAARSVAHPVQRSASEPFVGADGRIR
jgi:curved DNA-binding protein CbpA